MTSRDETRAGHDTTSTYVYGVVPAPPVPPQAADASAQARLGVGQEHAGEVRFVVHGALAAAVSDVPTGWNEATRADAEAHERVLSELLARQTVVPMRFGVVIDSDEEVQRELLERYADRLEEILERLDGCVQMSVKAYYAEDALLREALARRPELKRRADELSREPVERTQAERIALGRDVAEAVEQQRERDQRALVEPLMAHVRDIRLTAPAGEREAVNAQVLVERRKRPALDDVVRGLAAAHELRLGFRYVGPLPPYSFSDRALESSEAA
jgi:hypothetical protein